MKRNIVYIGIAAIAGLLMGWLMFGSPIGGVDTKEAMDDTIEHEHANGTNSQLWTCSMHPQIMQPEPGDCPICGMDLIPSEAEAEGMAVNAIKMTKNAMALANIQTRIVGNSETDEAQGMITLSGKIVINEENKAIQASYFDGRLERLNVNYVGQTVRQGQLLATIYSPNLVAAQQELITAASLKDSQPGLYQAVRNKLKLWKLTEKQTMDIEASGKVLENFPIYATVSGTVTEVIAKEGNYVKQGQALLKVSNLNTVWAAFDAFENQLSELGVGQKIKITAKAHPNEEFVAKVSFIDPVLHADTRTVTVRATLSNNKGLFKPGMFVTGLVNGAGLENDGRISIPASALLWTGERSLVYLKTNPDEPVFEMREVTIAGRIGDRFLINSGLKVGDEIVTNGSFTVDAAAQLQGKKSMMNKEGGKTMTGHEGHSGMQEESAPHNSDQSVNLTFPASFGKELRNTLASYMQMKEAFVVGKSSEVMVLAKTISKKLSAIKVNDLGQKEAAYITKSIQILDAMAKTDTLENQREDFVVLNQNMVPIVMNIAAGDTEIHVQKCPMANNNKGAIWLSMDQEIKNPYYGDAMLHCGSIVATLSI